MRDLTPGDIVIMDNLASHKSEAVHELIERTPVPAALFARPEPGLNPIEQAFAKLKQSPAQGIAVTLDTASPNRQQKLGRYADTRIHLSA